MEISDEYSSLENYTESLNLSESEYLRDILGPKHLPLNQVLPVTLAYVAIFITGVFGNVVTCIVIRRNPAMHTATYYYLFNLAISDLLLLILGLPNELSVFWQQYPWKLGLGMCKIRAYVSEMSSYVSVLTIVAFSLERYIAICHPLHLYASGLKRPIRFIVGAWLTALICAIPFAVYTRVNYVEYPPKSGRYSKDSAVCAMLLKNMPDFPFYELSCFIFFLIPMIFIAALYVLMGLRIQKKSLGRSIEGSVHGETKQIQSRKAIIRMLSAVVITFFICWAPFHAQRLLYVYQISAFGDINEWLYPLGGCLYYFSTTVNPILYNVMSAKYRLAFKETLCCSPNKPSIARDDLTSVRDITVCSSRRGSQVVGVYYQRSVKCNAGEGRRNVLRKSSRLSPDRQDGEKHHTMEPSNMSVHNRNASRTKTIEKPLLQERNKALTVVRLSNGRPRCQTFEKDDGTSSSETHI